MITCKNTKTITAAKAIVATLEQLGVQTVFGYPGGIVLDLYDELYCQDKINHILVRHEQAAVHAAEGYARTSGKCGVVIVTSGPGATNTVTGIANAYLDGYPLVILTGQVAGNLIGKNAFQEVNICDMVKSCTKAVFQLTNANNIQETLLKAFEIANSGKKGPVLIDIAKNVFSEKIQDFQPIKILNKENFTTVSDEIINQVYDRILSSNSPVIVAGGGVVHSSSEEELFNFAKSMKIPVVSTMMGIGTFPQDDLNYFGMLGIFGDNSANQILKEADLVISLGARFNDRITCKFQNSDFDNKIIQVDINQQEPGNNFKPLIPVVADIKDFLTKINKKLSQKQNFVSFDLWLNQAQKLKESNTKPHKTTNLMHSFEVIQKLDNFSKGKDVIFTSEVGQHQLWAVKNLKLSKDRKILVSGGLGTMGFGLPAAIGAGIANPDKTVICITGDGSFQMTLEELAVCKDYGLNIKIIILNNGYLGMVRQLQEKNCGGRYSQTKISNPDFVKLAQSYDIPAAQISSVNEIDNALDKAFTSDGAFIIDCKIEPMEIL